VFLDRDGVLNDLVPDLLSGHAESPLDPDEVSLLPGAAPAVRRARDAGYMLIGISNQPAAAKGTATREGLGAVQAKVVQLLERGGAVLDGFELCLHHPQGVVADLAVECECRKPKPGMILRASERLGIDLRASWVVGDTDADMSAAAAAGVRAILVEHPGSAHKRIVGGNVPRVRDLSEAVDLILRERQ
jgi:D-glycero-D-manno-heptose 1,7-bisphosphate phosphatase